jgi:hypothetical protein
MEALVSDKRQELIETLSKVDDTFAITSDGDNNPSSIDLEVRGLFYLHYLVFNEFFINYLIYYIYFSYACTLNKFYIQIHLCVCCDLITVFLINFTCISFLVIILCVGLNSEGHHSTKVYTSFHGQYIGKGSML